MPNFLIYNSHRNVGSCHETANLTGQNVFFEREADIVNEYQFTIISLMITINYTKIESYIDAIQIITTQELNTMRFKEMTEEKLQLDIQKKSMTIYLQLK